MLSNVIFQKCLWALYHKVLRFLALTLVLYSNPFRMARLLSLLSRSMLQARVMEKPTQNLSIGTYCMLVIVDCDIYFLMCALPSLGDPKRFSDISKSELTATDWKCLKMAVQAYKDLIEAPMAM